MMAGDVYRDSYGRFSKERGATFKQSGDRHFIWLFGRWAELKPVTPESFRESMKRYDRAMDDARQITGIGDAMLGQLPKATATT